MCVKVEIIVRLGWGESDGYSLENEVGLLTNISTFPASSLSPGRRLDINPGCLVFEVLMV